MCTAQQETVTRLLNGVAHGEAGAAAELLPMVYDELRSLAAALFRDQKTGARPRMTGRLESTKPPRGVGVVM